MIKQFFLTVAMILALSSMVHAATYIICRSPAYTRSGIDDVGDVIEIWEGPEAPSGPGYALSEIITVEALSKEDVEIKLNTIRPEVQSDPESPDKEYWRDPSTGDFYEVKIRPKYQLNAAQLTLADKVILADEAATSLQQLTTLGKIEANIAKYPENFTTPKPGDVLLSK